MLQSPIEYCSAVNEGEIFEFCTAPVRARLQVNEMLNIAERVDAQKSFKGLNRTLRLLLTDGHQFLHAIESVGCVFASIAFLHDSAVCACRLEPVAELVDSLPFGFKVRTLCVEHCSSSSGWRYECRLPFGTWRSGAALPC